MTNHAINISKLQIIEILGPYGDTRRGWSRFSGEWRLDIIGMTITITYGEKRESLTMPNIVRRSIAHCDRCGAWAPDYYAERW